MSKPNFENEKECIRFLADILDIEDDLISTISIKKAKEKGYIKKSAVDDLEDYINNISNGVLNYDKLFCLIRTAIKEFREKK